MLAGEKANVVLQCRSRVVVDGTAIVRVGELGRACCMAEAAKPPASPKRDGVAGRRKERLVHGSSPSSLLPPLLPSALAPSTPAP